MGRRSLSQVAELPPRWCLNAEGLLRRYIRISVQLSMAAGGALAPLASQAAPPFGSSAWFAQQAATVANPSAAPISAAAPRAVIPGSRVTTPQQALQQSARAMADLSRTAAAISDAYKAQSAARQLSLAQPNPTGVVDGLNANGGLAADANAARDLANPGGCSIYNCSWYGAQLPSETVDQGHHTVTVTQTNNKAILNWTSFNIGRNTTLNFDQSAGTQADGSNSWIALNRISAGSSPSQILGEIKAQGSVYLINPSGFLFGGSSAVNVHSLLATSLVPTLGGSLGADAFGSNYSFLTAGFFGGNVAMRQAVENLQYVTENGVPVLVNNQTPVAIATGDIEVQAGAQLRSDKQGYVLLAAPNVRNAGQIVADDGQAVLAAGLGVAINATSTGARRFSVTAGKNGIGEELPAGELRNTGLIQAARGGVQLDASDIELGSAALDGTELTQHSTVVSSTSISQPGSIRLRADSIGRAGDLPGYTGVVDIEAGSVLALLPDYNGETTTSSAAADAAFVAGSVQISGGSIRMMGNSLIEAPGQSVSLDASTNVTANTALPATGRDGAVAGRVYLDDGATIDVAGLADVQLAMSANLVEIPRLGQNELADSPLQRDGILFRAPITVDARKTGTRSDGSVWYGTPIANVNGYVDLVPRTIGQMLQNGGNINLAGQQVLSHKGSQLILDGGYLHYLGGVIQTTRLIAANGAVVDIADADASTRYTGFDGQVNLNYARANVTERYENPLLGRGYYESEYIKGGNAGKLSIALSGYYADDYTPVGFTQVLNGSLSARALAGRYQVANGSMPSGGSFQIGKISGDTLGGGALSFQVLDRVQQLDQIESDFSYSSLMSPTDSSVRDPWNHPELPIYWSQVSGIDLANAGFARIALATSGVIRVDESGLRVQPGGSISLTGSLVKLAADLYAPAGSIAVRALGRTANTAFTDTSTGYSIFVPAADAPGAALPGNIEVSRSVSLSTRGLWINDSGAQPDEIGGSAFINGGSISLVTEAASGAQLLSGDRISGAVFEDNLRDLTGSVILDAGSTLDVSSGGRVLPNGQLASSKGVALGKGGSIELAVYDQPLLGTYTQPPLFTDIETGEIRPPYLGTLQLGGRLLANGFAGGGTLRLQALGFSIADGNTSQTLTPGTLQLGSAFFSGGGFANYELAAFYDTTVSGTLRPSQAVFDTRQSANLARLLAAASGSDLYALTSVGALRTIDGQLDEYSRYRALPATSLQLYSGAYLGWGEGSAGAFPDYRAACAQLAVCISGATTLSEGASILAENGASVTLGSLRQVTVQGSIIAHGGRITLSGDVSDNGFAPVPALFPSQSGGLAYASSSKSVWLGANSLLDVSGVSLINAQASPVQVNGLSVVPRTGLVLDGGDIVLSNDSGYVLAQSGARLRFSGAADVFDLPDSSSTRTVSPQAVWSDAGSLTLGAAAGLYFNATLEAQAGAAADGSGHGRGGTLIVAPERPGNAALVAEDGSSGNFVGARQLLISQHAVSMPAGAAQPGSKVEDSRTPSGKLYLAADLLQDSGIDDLVLGEDPAKSQGRAALPIRFTASEDGSTSVSLQTGRSIIANTSVLGADDNVAVTLDAAYVGLHGYVLSGNTSVAVQPQSGSARLNVNAQAIDIGGQLTLSGFANAALRSSGDLRFSTPAIYTSGVALGALLSAGDMRFSAQRIYAATANQFVLASLGADATIGFASVDNSVTPATPLSAGSTLAVDAAHIEQAGALYAPQGRLILGVGDANDGDTRALFQADKLGLNLVQTQSLSLAAGSISSVSLAGSTVPYGFTVDGSDLLYNRAGGTQAYLDAPPEKLLLLAGDSLNLSAQARVDLSGGGDLQAQEFVAGTGGSKDVLSGSGVYAILPSANSSLAAYDRQFSDDPLLGQAVHLSGVPGLPEGDYTLLPARYATLPGAYRLVQDRNAIDTLSAQNRQLADGTQYVAGYFVDRFSGARNARSTGFYLQSSDAGVWQQYSEYTLSSATRFFADKATREGTQLPQLPRDAGHLVMAPGSALSGLDADFRLSGASDGNGALVDITAQRLQVLASGQSASDGFVGLAVDALNDLGAASLLLGGTRIRDTQGETLLPGADTVRLSNGSQTLFAPEILLLTRGSSDAGQGLLIDESSRIAARGKATTVTSLSIGREASTDADAVAGDGALLRVSNSAAVDVQRVNAASGLGTLQIAAGAQISADDSVIIDSTDQTRLDASARLSAAAITANSTQVHLLGDDASVDRSTLDGIVLDAGSLATLQAARQLSLNSRQLTYFHGSQSLSFAQNLILGAPQYLSDGGQTQLQAQQLTLGNILQGTAGSSAAGSGTLSLQARQLTLTGGNTSFSGFARLDADFSQGVLAAAKGRIDLGQADLNWAAPVWVSAAGSNTTLRSDGSLQLLSRSAGGALSMQPLGGSLSLQGSSLNVGTELRARSGLLSLQASQGDLLLASGAQLNVAGTAATFFDVTQYASAGSIDLRALLGDVRIESGASLNFAADARGGDAGLLRITADQGALQLAGALAGGAAKGRGGSLLLDQAASYIALDTLAQQLAQAGIHQKIAIRTGQGDLSLSGTLQAQQVSLSADGGAVQLGSTALIDASGAQGGRIQLFGRSGVDLQGQLDAHATDSGAKGGEVQIGTSGAASGQYDAQYGYQLVQRADSGELRLGADARIDVSGGSGGQGGLVQLRAPLLADRDVRIDSQMSADNIVGARELSLEAYATWSTTDSTTGAQHFDGYIDPAGQYTSQGTRLRNAQISAGQRNQDHLGFYGDTLLNAIRNPGFSFESRLASLGDLRARMGVSLINPDLQNNNGQIQVLSHWNLGAATRNADGSLQQWYRYQGNAPVLNLQAAGDIKLLASISDGFYQYANPFADDQGVIAALPEAANGISPSTTDGVILPLLAMTLATQVDAQGRALASYDASSYRLVAGAGFDSADPLRTSAAARDAGLGAVILDQHQQTTVYNPDDPSLSRLMVAPTLLRTGVGSIDVVAAGNIELRDTVAPGVIYSSGHAQTGTVLGTTPAVLYPDNSHPWLVDSGESHPVEGGRVQLLAGGDISAYRGVVDRGGKRSGLANATLDQYWWPWMQGLCTTLSTSGSCDTDTSARRYSLVNFAAFGQGVLSAGGDVQVSAAGSIRNLSVSLPTTYWFGSDDRSYSVLGGGSLMVSAGGDILGGDYFVSRGAARISADGSIAGGTGGASVNGTILALQDAQLNVRARLALTLGDVLNPSYMNSLFDVQPYGSEARLQLQSLAGDIRLGRNLASAYGYGDSSDVINGATSVWPATLDATAFTGGLTLALQQGTNLGLSAAPQGQLSLLAAADLSISGSGGRVLGLFDVDPAQMASPLGGNVLTLGLNVGDAAAADHAAQALHAADSEPVRLYSRDGDVIEILDASQSLSLLPNKPAAIRAGRDIVNLNFIGQNLYDSDISLIEAGRDIRYDQLPDYRARLDIAGPGTLAVVAGRDIGPIPASNSTDPASDTGLAPLRSGIKSVGNRYNPYLSRADGADLLIEFGVAPGIALDEFAAAYLSPTRSVSIVPDYSAALIAFVDQIQRDAATRKGEPQPQKPTLAQAWAAYLLLPRQQQQRLVFQVFYDILDQVGLDYNTANSPYAGQYLRGYVAINTLFPAQYGYSANNLEGGSNGAAQPVSTGNFDMRSATVQTEQGGSIAIIGPGGNLLVGSTAAQAAAIPSRQGILTLGTGDISIFTDRSTLLAQSRIFTLQGGDLLMWSSNGDINAGKGAKTSSELPSTTYLCDPDQFCVTDNAGKVSGAGIAALQTLPGGAPGSANLVAPSGTVDAGDAGIRVSGNLNIAALRVANADNIQVQGSASGIPSSAVNTAALGAASAAAAAASDAAQDLARKQTPAESAATMLTVDVLGFGALPDDEKRKSRHDSESSTP